MSESYTGKAWLLTWNPNKGGWDSYKKDLQSNADGYIVTLDWNCQNTHTQIGDEVYLMRVGSDPRCIVAYGTVASENHLEKHFDGNNTNYIDVDVEIIEDYNDPKCVQLKQLQELFPEQKWNPQRSGIAIKAEYVDPLRELVTGDFYEPVSQQLDYEQYEGRYEKNMILYGPPGTGKTFHTKSYAVAICDGYDPDVLIENTTEENRKIIESRYAELVEEGRIVFVTFHQSFGYEEFIEGIYPVLSDGEQKNLEYEIKDGVFKSFCLRAEESLVEQDEEEKRYVFVIDEINRGNISKIFGELITLIEETKRKGATDEMTTILPYSGDRFSVPDNVYLIGTMNTADRSIAMLDTALRRRFTFKSMYPSYEVIQNIVINEENKSLNVADMLRVINDRIEYFLDKDHTIGHAYFTALLNDPSLENLSYIFRNRILPLLEEYFYNDFEKIRLILGDNSKSSEAFEFVFAAEANGKLFNGNPDIEEQQLFTINDDAFYRIESYKEIAEGL